MKKVKCGLSELQVHEYLQGSYRLEKYLNMEGFL